MKKIMMILIILFVASGCFALPWEHDPWTTQDTVLQLTFSALAMIDFWQTYTFLYTGTYKEQGYYETNPILGNYPSKIRFFSYAGICIIGHLLISYILPQFFRTIWQIAWSCIEIKYIHHNYQINIRIINKQF
jgi:hypothetical protein